MVFLHWVDKVLFLREGVYPEIYLNALLLRRGIRVKRARACEATTADIKRTATIYCLRGADGTPAG